MDHKMDAMLVFEELLSTFSRDLRLAETLESPNPEDSLEIRAAIVGFSYNSPTEAWKRFHLDYIRNHLPDLTTQPKSEVAFQSLCLGYLLGLYQIGAITDQQLLLAEYQLPGFILSKGDWSAYS